MADSSDEDVNSDNEFIDLKPLWQDRPFIDVRDNGVPANTQSAINIEDDSPDRIIELTPTASATEELDPLQSLMNEITNMSRRVTNARIARQRILNLGRPVSMDGDNNGSLGQQPPNNQNPIWHTHNPTAAGCTTPRSENQANQTTEEGSRIPYRFSQIRHIVTGTSPTRWARGRQTFSSVVPTTARFIEASNRLNLNDDAKLGKMTRLRETRFVLPAAIRARERDCAVDDIMRADRALFVSDLMLSSLKKRNSHHSEYISQENSSVTFDSKFNTNKKRMSERDLADRISDEETDEYHSAQNTEWSGSSKEYESRVLTDVSSDSD